MIKHLISISDLSKSEVVDIISQAEKLKEVNERDIKKVPTLRGKTIINLFLEPSTRTRLSFEIGGKRLSADTINLSSSGSSALKGESFADTLLNIQALNPDIIVLRDKNSGSPFLAKKYLSKTAVINAGDGMREHPTQALLDLMTIKQVKKKIDNLKICIIGDIRHSRVAKSNIYLHMLLGNEINLVGPETLVPLEFQNKNLFGNKIKIFDNIQKGIENADVIICLRMQFERMQDSYITTIQDYIDKFALSEKLYNKYSKDAMILHPGPVNRGVELDSKLIEQSSSYLQDQVNNGLALRMALLIKYSYALKEENA